jgi:hypothetical protein
MVTDSVTMNTSMRAVDSTDARMVWMVSEIANMQDPALFFNQVQKPVSQNDNRPTDKTETEA